MIGRKKGFSDTNQDKQMRLEVVTGSNKFLGMNGTLDELWNVFIDKKKAQDTVTFVQK